MDRKIVYIAHPVSGNVEENLKNAAKWYRWAALEQLVLPLMPWFECCHSLDDHSEFERGFGIGMDHVLIERLPFDELWLCGLKISSGMKDEAMRFEARGLVIRDFTGSVEPPDDCNSEDSRYIRPVGWSKTL